MHNAQAIFFMPVLVLNRQLISIMVPQSVTLKRLADGRAASRDTASICSRYCTSNWLSKPISTIYHFVKALIVAASVDPFMRSCYSISTQERKEYGLDQRHVYSVTYGKAPLQKTINSEKKKKRERKKKKSTQEADQNH